MIQKHRINTNIGRDQRVNVEINQNFDIMEILSLKFSQKDIYASGNCSEYGVVVGRVSANDGYGLPNTRVSIFIAQSEMHEDDPVISSLYPYKEINDKDENGYRYNLLPERQQHAGHTPTGTFPDQQDILTREEVLEVFEDYYKYTVKTNNAGDFMIWGVPIGTQTIHVDIDLSDIGCFSLRPYDFIRKGHGIADFERYYQFKSSSDLDGLPQIVTFDRGVEVYPLWGNEELCEIGITRTDFDLSDKGIKIEPISLVLLSTVTDDNSDAVKRNGKIRKKAGYKCNLQTTGGKIECVRQTGRVVLSYDGTQQYPELEYFTANEVIDEEGTAMVVLPMNGDYVYTNSLGEEIVTNDPTKGIPTTTTARFRLTLETGGKKKGVAHYLVPNIREFNPTSSGTLTNDGNYEGQYASYVFSDVFEDYITPSTPDGVSLTSTGYDDTVKEHKRDLMLGTNNNGIPEDYFYKFIYGKVYTVSSFQGTHYETAARDAFLGIKQIRPATEDDCASQTNYIPTNFGFKNRTKFSLLLAQVLLFVQYIFAIILVKFAEILGSFLWTVGNAFYSIRIFRWRPFRRIGEWFLDLAYRVQDRFTQILPLTIYPDCEECTTDDESFVTDASFADNYCRVAELGMYVRVDGTDVILMAPDTDTASLYYTGATQLSHLAQTGDTYSGIFQGEYARDEEGACSGTTTPDYSDLDTLYSETITPTPPDERTEQYVAQLYSYRDDYDQTTITGGTLGFAESSVFISNSSGVENVRLYQGSYGGDTGTYFTMSYEDWNELTGMEIDSETETWLQGDGSDLLWVILRLYDRSINKNAPTTGSTLETGCERYDTIYNESIAFGYIWSSGTTYGDVTLPWDPSGVPESSENIASYADAPGFREFLPGTTPPSPYANLLSTLIGTASTRRLPSRVSWRRIGLQIYDRKTKSGLSELRDGVYTVIPVVRGTRYSVRIIQEWYRRKRVGLTFCGGVVNYSFIDNWLHGLLYFFKFDRRVRWDNEAGYDLNHRGTKYPRELVFYNHIDKKFYYRSCPYYNEEFVGQTYDGIREILHPTTFYDVGVRDEFLHEICVDPKIDPNCSVVRDISVSSYQDPANVVEYAISYRLDINNGDFDVNDFFSGRNYGSNIHVFDGDVTQLMSINCEAGIEEFDLDSPQYYMYNTELFDPEDTRYTSYFMSGTTSYGPTPIDFKFDTDGEFIRSCLNYRLGDYSQVVPFYLWDKSGPGFGPYGGGNSDDQEWDKTEIAYMKLQRLFSVSGTSVSDLATTNYLMANGEEEYLLRPMTINHDVFWFYGDYEDSLERFETISYSAPSDTSPGGAQSMGYIEGNLWLEVVSGSISDPQSGYVWAVVNSTWTIQYVSPFNTYFENSYETFLPETALNYWGNRQVLSTPFLFYFGLRPGKSALDKLIKYFGPKDAFATDPIDCPAYNVTPSPSATPGASLLPEPTPESTDPYVSVTPSRSPTPTPTLTPGPTPSVTSPGLSFGIHPTSGNAGESSWPDACAIGTPTGSAYTVPTDTAPTEGHYLYTDATLTTTFVGDGGWYFFRRETAPSGQWAAIVSGTGLIGTVVDCITPPSPTPTPSVTPTITPSITVSPTPSLTPPNTPTPSPVRKSFGIYDVTSYGTSGGACAQSTPTGTVYHTIGYTVPTTGQYFYTTQGGSTGFSGDGNYYMIYDNGTRYACVISGTGLIGAVVSC